MSDWMSGPHRAQRTVDLEVTPDPEPVELTEPVDVVAWLRALPVGTVLLAANGRAWQVRMAEEYRGPDATAGRPFVSLEAAGSGMPFELAQDAQAASVAQFAPFRVLWMPGGAT